MREAEDGKFSSMKVREGEPGQSTDNCGTASTLRRDRVAIRDRPLLGRIKTVTAGSGCQGKLLKGQRDAAHRRGAPRDDAGTARGPASWESGNLET